MVIAGVAAVVTPAVKLLDRIYATRITLEGLAAKYGDRPLEWPVQVVEQLTERNQLILQEIEEHIGSMPSGLFYPLGACRAHTSVPTRLLQPFLYLAISIEHGQGTCAGGPQM